MGSRFRCPQVTPRRSPAGCWPQPEVLPIGLGARNSLRLEAGLCLYGHDIDETTTPIEADLAWTIGRRRRAEGGFPGAAVVLRELAEGAGRRRIGIRPDGRAPAREDTAIVGADGSSIGRVTSGGFGPSVGARSRWAMSIAPMPRKAPPSTLSSAACRDPPAPCAYPLFPTATTAADRMKELMDQHCASFETVPPGPPQDEVFPYAIKEIPHAEERQRRVSKHARHRCSRAGEHRNDRASFHQGP